MEAGIEPSVGGMGDGCDDAPAEATDGLFKAEVIHRRGPWRSFGAVERAALGWVDRCDHCRSPEPTGDVPPAGAAFHATFEATPMAARSQADRPPMNPGRLKLPPETLRPVWAGM